MVWLWFLASFSTGFNSELFVALGWLPSMFREPCLSCYLVHGEERKSCFMPSKENMCGSEQGTLHWNLNPVCQFSLSSVPWPSLMVELRSSRAHDQFPPNVLDECQCLRVCEWSSNPFSGAAISFLTSVFSSGRNLLSRNRYTVGIYIRLVIPPGLTGFGRKGYWAADHLTSSFHVLDVCQCLSFCE